MDHLYVKCTVRWHYAWATKRDDAVIGDEEDDEPEPEEGPDPEPEVDYDEWGTEIPLQRNDGGNKEEEEGFRGRGFDERSDEDSAWSRSPSRSPVRKVTELDERWEWMAEQEARQAAERDAWEEEKEQYVHDKGYQEDAASEASEGDYGQVVHRGPGLVESDWKPPAYPAYPPDSDA